MKVKLIHAYGDPQPGWVNLNPFGNNGCETSNLDNIDFFVCDGEASVIHALDVLQHYQFDKIPQLIRHWVSKLGIGGHLIISFEDIFLLTKAFYNGGTVRAFSEAIHGKQEKPYQFKRCSMSTQEVLGIFRQLPVKVISTRIDSPKVFIEVVRQ